jgi:hypothetical protein
MHNYQYSHNESLIFLDKFGRETSCISENKLKPTFSQKLIEKGFSPEYPNNKKFAICISHDIDHLYHFPNQNKNYIGGLRNVFELLKHEFKSKVNNDNYINLRARKKAFSIENLINIHEQYDIRSTYYFLSLLPHEQDFNYHPSEIKDIFELLNSKNNEIGLHGGHQAYLSSEKIYSEKKLLEDATQLKIKGYRNHYLKFSNPNTWNYLNENGFLYDSTYGNFDHIGFKGGNAYPFKPLWTNQSRDKQIVELPLAIMDGTLFKYMHLDTDKALSLVNKLMIETINVSGVLTLLWHNSYLNGIDKERYLKILDLLMQNDPWICTSDEIVDYFESKNYFNQIQDIIDTF